MTRNLIFYFIFVVGLIGYSQSTAIVNFTADATSGFVPLDISFTDTSLVPDGYSILSWNWSFGDGEISSEQNPFHEYDEVGTFNVSLTIDYGNGTSVLEKPSYIRVSESPPEFHADFIADPVVGIVPLSVYFYDISSGPIEWWNWDFGDGNTSDEQNPAHDYSNPGKYNVSLAIGNDFESDNITVVDLITVEVAPLPLEQSFGTSTLLTPGTPETDQESPDVSNDIVVWSGYSDNSHDIFVYDLTTGQETDITPDEKCQNLPDRPYPDQIDPAIDGDFIVWVDGRNINSDIYLFDLETGNETLVTPNTSSSNQVDPYVSGDHIVWSDDRHKGNFQYDIYLYSIGTREEVILSPDMPTVSLENPRLSGDYVVCEGYDLNNWSYDIYLCKISLGTWTILTPDTPWSNQKNADISGDYIIWDSDESQGTIDIYLYNLLTDTVECLTEGTSTSSQMNPKIDGETVVWEDNRVDGGWVNDIVQYDITSGIVSLITPDTITNQVSPEISGNHIVWSRSDPDTSMWNVYLFTMGLEKPPLVADFSSNVSSSEAPMTVAFTDQTIGEPAFWFWDFGDGNTSDEQNPEHIFVESGSYDVTLWVGNPFQRSIEKKDDYISAGSAPVAKFSADPQSGILPLSVQFSDQSSGNPTSWEWDFGDNTTSTEQHPSHNYFNEGTYSVTLSVTNEYGTSNLTKTGMIMVTEATEFGMNFTIPGIEFETIGGIQQLTFDGDQISDFSLNISNHELIVNPPDDCGISEITFVSDPAGFNTNGTIIIGNLTSVCFCSQDITTDDSGNSGVFNYSFCSDTYPESGTIKSLIWSGVFPTDYTEFDSALDNYPDYGDIHDIAFTLDFESGIMTGESIVTFGVDAHWVGQYGEGDNGTVIIESQPASASVFIDGTYRGLTPLSVTELSPGWHNLTLTRTGYEPEERMFRIRDNRNSIKILRVGDDGKAEVLNTTFMYHDSTKNMDYFQAYSPKGFSRFAVSALGGPGNIFQIIQLTATKVIGPSGGGGGGSSDYGGSTTTTTSTTSSTTPVVTVTAAPKATTLPDQSPPTAFETQVPSGIPPEVTAATGETAGQPEPGQGSPFSIITGGTSSMIFLKNLSIVFVVIFVTMLFYLRWRRRED